MRGERTMVNLKAKLLIPTAAACGVTADIEAYYNKGYVNGEEILK